jgi:hypothetical protein
LDDETAAFLELQCQCLRIVGLHLVAHLEVVEVLHVGAGRKRHLVALRSLERDVARLLVDRGDGGDNADGLDGSCHAWCRSDHGGLGLGACRRDQRARDGECGGDKQLVHSQLLL